MRVSLVLGTKGRTAELDRFLGSLAKQTHKEFELIVVDQNPDDRLVPVLASFQSQIKLVHLRSQPGLNRGRNVGLKQASGDVIAIPDDDCYYPENVLEYVVNLLDQHPEWDGVTGFPEDPKLDYKISPPGKINLFNAWHRGITCTIFLRKRVIEKVGDFDEDLGPGSGTPWGASDEIDYLIRAMQAGFTLFYEPTLIVQHLGAIEEKDLALSPQEEFKQHLRKVRSYAMSDGRVLAKRGYPIWFVIYQLVRPIGGALVYLLSGRLDKVRIRLVYTRGKLRGWLGII